MINDSQNEPIILRMTQAEDQKRLSSQPGNPSPHGTFLYALILFAIVNVLSMSILKQITEELLRGVGSMSVRRMCMPLLIKVPKVS